MPRPIDVGDAMRATLERNLVRYLVQRTIFCPVSGDVLDVRSCAVIRDDDGDPVYVISPRAADAIEAAGDGALKAGYTLDRRQR